MLIPRRADSAWVLDFLRGVSPGPLFAVCPPLAAMGFRASPSEAVMWRDGDLLLAFHTDFEFSAVDSPIFRAPMAAPVHVHVRHTALWQLDFRVDAPL